ncbi:unnamed protein product [Cuscuta europaea]|uniref:Uncharacterized protein n=1 Tax=Cuscuta europaea TaxID=41803 RepID=A0A9P0Z054_CUSEU|nr:unnamed protein product [Cuscuta europaea]
MHARLRLVSLRRPVEGKKHRVFASFVPPIVSVFSRQPDWMKHYVDIPNTLIVMHSIRILVVKSEHLSVCSLILLIKRTKVLSFRHNNLFIDVTND